MDPEARQYLLDQQLVSQDQLDRAEMHARAKRIPFELALKMLDIIDLSQLGSCLSDLHKMPYAPLVDREMPAATHTAISRECCERWQTFPVDCDPGIRLLTFAVENPTRAGMLRRVYHFLLKPYDLAFTVATQAEIREATAIHFGQSAQPSTSGNAGETDSRPSAGPQRKKRIRSSPSTFIRRQPTAVASPAPASRQEVVATRKKSHDLPDGSPELRERNRADDLAKSLTTAISLLVSNQLQDQPEKIALVRARARYCQLLATRLNLTSVQSTKTTLAAWASGLDHKPDLLKQLATPYDLESVIFEKPGDKHPAIEAQILALVRCYEEFHDEDRDVNIVRRYLLVRWSSAAACQDIVETFLQVLMDEQFLSRLDRKTGTILVLDPAASIATEIVAPLERAGYKIQVLSNTHTAVQAIQNTAPDLIIAGAESSATGALEFCRHMKNAGLEMHVPIIALLPEGSEIRGAEFLRVGADDFLAAPVDLELLYLKVERLLSAPVHPAAKQDGVTGSLVDMSFSDIVQILSAGSRSMKISVSSGANTGSVVIKDGNVIHAEVGNLVGEGAFYALMQWHEGDFAMSECKQFPEPTIQSSTMSLLMEGARLEDEGAQ